jgi:hypothetical protein
MPVALEGVTKPRNSRLAIRYEIGEIRYEQRWDTPFDLLR